VKLKTAHIAEMEESMTGTGNYKAELEILQKQLSISINKSFDPNEELPDNNLRDELLKTTDNFNMMKVEPLNNSYGFKSSSRPSVLPMNLTF